MYVCYECIYSSSVLQLNSVTGTQAVFTECDIHSNKILIGVVYRPPGVCSSEFIEEITEILEQVNHISTTTIFAGDFNFDLFQISTDNYVVSFLDMCLSHGLFPCISKTTRPAPESASLIDNFFCSNLSFITEPNVILNDISDHFPIYIKLIYKKDRSHTSMRKSITSFDYNNIPELQAYLQLQLVDFFEITNAENACNIFIDAFVTGISRYSYTYKPSLKKTPTKPWISAGLLVSINKKNELFRIKNQRPTTSNISNYKRYKN